MVSRWLYAWGLGSVGFGGASLLIPLYIVQLGATAVDLGILAATATIVGAPGAIVFGRLADRVGHRRSLILLTLGSVAVVLAIVPLFQSVDAVIVANAGLWLVVASVSPVLTMLIVAEAPESQWSGLIGQLNKFQGYGWAGGLVIGAVWTPLTGGLLGPTLSTRSLFWVLACCAALAAVGSARTLPRPAPGNQISSERAVRRVAKFLTSTRGGVKDVTFAFAPNRLYWTTRGIHPRRLVERFEPAMATYLAGAGLFFAGFAAFWAPLPLFFTDIGFNAGQIFGLYLLSSLASAVLYEHVGKVAASTDLRVLQAGALGLRGVFFFAVALAGGITTFWVSLVASGLTILLIGFTWAVIAVVGTAIVTRLAPPGVRGEMLGIHTALMALAGGVGSLVGGWLASIGYHVAFGTAGLLVIGGAVLVASVTVLSGGKSSVSSDTTPPV